MKPFLIAVVLSAVPTFAFAGHWAEKGRGPKKITVTIHSMPEGATVYANDARTPMGQTPLNLEYALDGSDRCQTRQGMAVQWASGAKAEISTLQLCPTTGKHQQYTFTRPTDAPDAAVDESLALQRQQVAVMQDMLAAQQTDAMLARLQQSLTSYAAIAAATRPIACHTYRIGRHWFTNCY